MNGFIYVMSNPIFSDNRIKIGKSKSDPSSLRKDELYSTGVPEPFKVEYFAFVEDYDNVEIKIHRILDNKRPNKNREFFTSTIPEAILAIKQNSKVKYEEVFYKSPHEIQIEKRKQLEEKQSKELAKKLYQQESIKRKQEDERRQRQKEENEKLEWVKKKDNFKQEIKVSFTNGFKFLLSLALIWGGYSLCFVIVLEYLLNGFGFLLLAIATGLLLYFHIKFVK